MIKKRKGITGIDIPKLDYVEAFRQMNMLAQVKPRKEEDKDKAKLMEQLIQYQWEKMPREEVIKHYKDYQKLVKKEIDKWLAEERKRHEAYELVNKPTREE